MKKFILFLMLFSTSFVFSAVKITDLPLGTAATTGVNDSFPYVASGLNITKRLTLWDLVNLPTLAATYAPLTTPTFTGLVTASAGIKTSFIKSEATNPSTSGIVQLGNNESIGWRNQANGANLLLKANTSNLLEYDGVAVPTISSTSTLTNKTLTSPTLNTPTIGTSAVVPLVIGGTGTGSSLTLQSTSGVGASDSILFKVGNNGGTTAMTISTAGRLGVGRTPTTNPLEVNTAMSINASSGGSLNFAGGTGINFLYYDDRLTISKNGTGAALAFDANRYVTAIGMYNNTSASAANMFVDSSGIVYRSTSSIRYKKDVATYLEGLKKVNSLRPVTFKSKNKNDSKLYAGFIAEEVDKAGLKEFVEYDKQNKPDAVQYGHMVALAVKAIQELSVKNEELQSRIKLLESKK